MGRVNDAWRLLNLPCEGITHLASESFDRPLQRLERFVLRTHLLYCGSCRRYSRQIKILRHALGQLTSRLESDDPLPGPGLPDEVREKMVRRLNEE